MIPDKYGILPYLSYSLKPDGRATNKVNKIEKLLNKVNINQNKIPTVKELEKGYSMPDEVQLQDGNQINKIKKKPRKMTKGFN